MVEALRRPTLVVMLKAPVAGSVKTRLSREVGTAEALRFHRVVSAGLLRRLGRDPRWRTVLAVAPDGAVRATVWPKDLPRVGQGSGDLGARMQRLFDRLSRGPLVIVGSDIPGIDAGLVAAAFRILGDHDAVLGPAEDGGYWLVGLKRRPRVPRAFERVRWSTEYALADTLANLRNLRVALLAQLSDVDTPEDWRRWRGGRMEPGRRLMPPRPVSDARRGEA